jgi:hypothetical protein
MGHPRLLSFDDDIIPDSVSPILKAQQGENFVHQIFITDNPALKQKPVLDKSDTQ